MSSWNYDKLSNLCTKIGDGLHGTPEYSDKSGIYFINGNNLNNGKIDIDKNTKCISAEELNNNFIPLNKNTLLLSINGTLGSLAFYNNEKVMLGKSAAYLNFKSDINKFYYYYFQLPSIQQYFYNVATGSTIKNLSLKSIQDFEVPVPDSKEWKNIYDVLSSLDSKIELNKRINAELEALTKVLYDYWFVQFDFPDKSGKPYKSCGGKMVWNKELKRVVPEGWDVQPLFEAMDVQYGFPFSTSKFTYEITNKPVIRIRDILENTISTYTTEDVEDKYILLKNDLLIGMDGNFHLNFWDKDGAYLNQRSVRIRSKKDSDISNLQAYFQLAPYIKAREKNVSRTTVGHLSDKDMKRLLLITPNKSDKFKPKNLFDSMLSQITSNRLQNQKLSELRDWLLPMLMNGQVKVN